VSTDTATHPDTPEAPPPGAFEAGLFLAGAAFVALLAGVLAYGLLGARVTDGLDRACAEAAFKAGQQLEASGDLDGAEQRYRQALEGHFSRPEQRYMCGRSVGDLLSRRQRYAEAVEAYDALPPEALSEAGHYTAYVLSLWHSGQLDRAAERGRTWLGLAEQEQNREQRLWANNALMQVASARGETDQVLAYGAAVLELDPASVAALLVARTLLARGEADAALARVNAFIAATDNPAHLEEAKALRAAIAGSG